jgi:two-component system sensor histidine kinase VanS
MKLSIRTKLFISLNALVFFFVLMSFALTQLGLETYYIGQKKNILIESSQLIDKLYQGNPEDLSLELEKMSNTLGAGILILDTNGEMKYSSFGPSINKKIFHRTPRNTMPMPPYVLKSEETIDKHTVLKTQLDPGLKIDFILLEHQLRNGDILLLRQPLAPVSESATVAAQFMLFTGILSILLGCLWAFFFAKKFTHPIFELSRIAQSMSRLDFSQKCTINRNDEIGRLGESINHLSDQLDTAISELNQKNRQLMADVEKERQLDKMRKDFVSSVSHELKTPLALILGYAEGLKENVASDEESRNYYASIIIDEAEKMDKLVKDLLNLSQIESGMFELSRSDFSIVLLLHDITLKYHTILAEKEITLELDESPDLLVNGDILRIEQILVNLLTNAIDHTEGIKKIRISLQETGEHLRVSVFNSGHAIPEASLEKIWISFYKVDKARTRKYGGYGLGLSIVRAIQELHGNLYGVENVLQGVLFWFDLDKA